MVELLCILTGILSGIAIVAALLQQPDEQWAPEVAPESETPAGTEGLQRRTTAWQLLTGQVATDGPDATPQDVHVTDALLPAEDKLGGVLLAITDLIQSNESMQGQLAAAQQRLSKQSEQLQATALQARTDALTGLANRRALEESLESCIASAGRAHADGLMLIDIDHFKSFNDSYGHTTGDAVLAGFAQGIAQWCRGRYYSARYGGEEFAILLTASSNAGLAQLAAEVRGFISGRVILHEDLRLTLTASAGLTSLTQGDTIKRALERADEGLYRSKQAGRNCGFWLDCGQWRPFPGLDAQRAVCAEAAAAEVSGTAATDLSAGGRVTGRHAWEAKRQPASETGVADAQTEPLHGCGGDQNAAAEPGPVERPQVLDVATLVERLETQLKFLRRAGLPASAIMVEAVGQTPHSASDFEFAWAEVFDLVQANLRDVDVICRVQQNTLCVFMPGCALQAALKRAAKMQQALAERLKMKARYPYPERLAIAAGCALKTEEAGVFLRRLEEALQEAQVAAPLELVVSESSSNYFYAV